MCSATNARPTQCMDTVTSHISALMKGASEPFLETGSPATGISGTTLNALTMTSPTSPPQPQGPLPGARRGKQVTSLSFSRVIPRIWGKVLLLHCKRHSTLYLTLTTCAAPCCSAPHIISGARFRTYLIYRSIFMERYYARTFDFSQDKLS